MRVSPLHNKIPAASHSQQLVMGTVLNRTWFRQHVLFLLDIIRASLSNSMHNFLKVIALRFLLIMYEPEKDVNMWVEDITLDSDSGPSLVYQLEGDVNRKEQLGFWDENYERTKTALHRENEQQLLKEGKLGRSEFSARLQKVKFGIFEGQPACLIVFLVDFCPGSQTWFRFRTATVEAEFQEEHPAIDTLVDDERDYDGPLVRKFYPELIRGHVRSIAETYNFTVSAGLPAPFSKTNLSAAWSSTQPKESAHLFRGRLMGDPATRVSWVINENKITKSGIYEQPKFATIVRHQDQTRFSMTLRITATTLAGFPVIGKGGSRIIFTPKQRHQADESNQPNLHDESPLQDLAEENLEDLTRMEAILLGGKGPGAPPTDIP